MNKKIHLCDYVNFNCNAKCEGLTKSSSNQKSQNHSKYITNKFINSDRNSVHKYLPMILNSTNCVSLIRTELKGSNPHPEDLKHHISINLIF